MVKNTTQIVAVIVTYNRLKLLKECIEALSKSTVKTNILIVNNASTDGTKEYLSDVENIYKDIKFYIYNQNENLNGAGGYNVGIREASKLDYKYIWLMDDDCIVKEDSLSELLKVADELKDDFGFLSSKVLWTDGNICKTNIQRRRVARRVRDFTSHIVKVDFCSFVSCLIKREDVLNVGLPIKEFIIWTDDLEWTRRFTYKKVYDRAKQGYLCNDSVVIHKCANNFGVTVVYDTKDRIGRYKYIYRNDVVCFRREGIRGHIYMFVRNIYHIFRILLFAKSDKTDRIKIVIKGYMDGYKFYPDIEYIN